MVPTVVPQVFSQDSLLAGDFKSNPCVGQSGFLGEAFWVKLWAKLSR